jgi:hypothetical protein
MVVCGGGVAFSEIRRRGGLRRRAGGWRHGRRSCAGAWAARVRSVTVEDASSRLLPARFGGVLRLRQVTETPAGSCCLGLLEVVAVRRCLGRGHGMAPAGPDLGRPVQIWAGRLGLGCILVLSAGAGHLVSLAGLLRLVRAWDHCPVGWSGNGIVTAQYHQPISHS